VVRAVVFRDVKKEWRFRLVDAENNETIAASEGYVRRIDAVERAEELAEEVEIEEPE
jgi:uncharacterized protein YegP (UPF0339 family)